jgi:hypothetical protein
LSIFKKIKHNHPLSKKFSHSVRNVLDDNWGRAKGGMSCCKVLRERYGEQEFVKRRSAGGKASIKKKLERITKQLPAPKDLRVLELLGALIGDGWIGISAGRKQVCFCGNLHQKKYAKHIQKILHAVFQVHGYLKLQEKNTVFYIIVNSGPIFDFFREKYDFPIGPKKKFNTDALPKEADSTNSIIRGIFDTDGSLYFDRGKGYARPYPVIDITSRNPELLDWISRRLTEKGFKVISLKYSIRLKTYGQVERWFNEIKPSNGNHIQKWNRWKSQYMGP